MSQCRDVSTTSLAACRCSRRLAGRIVGQARGLWSRTSPAERCPRETEGRFPAADPRLEANELASLDIEPPRTSPNEAVADELRLRMVSANADLGPGPYDRAPLRAFVCECGCHEPIPMSLRSFERARREGGGIIAPGTASQWASRSCVASPRTGSSGEPPERRAARALRGQLDVLPRYMTYRFGTDS